MPIDPTQLYSPGDFAAVRNRIFQDSLEAVRNRFPISNDRYTLSLENVDYDSPRDYTLRDQKKAVQNDQTLSWKIKGNWVLTDNASGKVISRSSRRSIMDVPYLTQRGTFIRSGTETTLPMQMRLVPGVYSRMGEDGIAKAHINARPGTGNTVMMMLNPAKPVFKVSVGTRNYDLFPLLKHLGATDDEIRNAWGKELYNVNEDAFVNGGGWYRAKTAADVDPNDPWEKAAKDVLGGELNEDNTMATFGTPYKKVDKDLLLASSARLIGLAKGMHSGDNRDSMENQRFFGPADFISERIRLDAGGLARNLLWRVSRYGDTEKIPSAPLTKYVHGLFTESNLAQAIEETNLLDAYKRATMVTRMGEGGIGSIESAPMSARLVHNSYKGFIAPVESPESLRVGLDTQIAHSARRGPNGLAYAPVIDAQTGQKVYLSTLESSKTPIAFPEFRESRDKLIPAMVGNDIEYLPRNQVRYFIPNGDSLFSTAADFIPIKSGIKAGRLLMAQKHQTQAMSVKDRMAPYVQSLDPDGSGKSVEEQYSDILGAVRSKEAGKVLRVNKDEIVVLGEDGKRHSYSMYDNYPLNRKSVVNNIAKVKPGDIVQPGQLLASSSYTDDNGVAALGTQLRSGWLSYKGWNYLDAIVVSESAAKKLTSEHFYHEGIDKDDGVEFGRDRYIAAFPSRFNRDQLSTIDKNGAVKPGTVVRHGDPLVLAMSLRPGGPGTGYRALHKDITSTWEHEFPGEVTDVVEGKDGLRVYVKSWVPLQVGDKLATRFANKGTCAAVIPDDKMPKDSSGRHLEILFSPTGIVSRCYDEKHELLTRNGWTPIALVKDDDELYCFDPKTAKGSFMKQIAPMHSNDYTGYLYICSGKDVEFAVTGGHRMWVMDDIGEGFHEAVVDDVYGKHVVLPVADERLRTYATAVQENDWRKQYVAGARVHCPTVPTGFVYTRRNGLISCLGNTNSAALVEAALGKVAEKTGKRYVLPGFGTDLTAFAAKELADAGLTDREDITDPDTGKTIKGVFTGNSYVTKFHHTSESKGGARSTGSYTADEQPASGGHDGAKTLGGLVLGAFAGHGASEVLKDMKLIKGQKNTDFWRDFKMGRNPVLPGTPLIYERFLASLEGSGIHVTRNGDKTNVFAMTNGDVDKIARAELNSAATYDDKRFLPIKGGMFDPAIFGPNGDQWAKVKLDEPVLNPIMDDVVCNFLGLKKAELDEVLSGTRKLPNGLTGGEGLRKQLASLNLDSMIENAKNTIRTGPPSRRDKAVKTLRWATAMQRHEATPDMFMLDSIPVLPPRYRRITKAGNLNMIADANYLYKQLIDARDDLRQAKEAGLPDELLAYGRKRITDSFRAVTGLAEPTDRKLVESDVSGLLKWVFGKGSPKCHDDETEILTEIGWLPIRNYKDASIKVATINPVTLLAEYQNPTDIIHQPYKGVMVGVSQDGVDFLVTPNHDVLVKDGRTWEKVKADRLMDDSYLSKTFMGWGASGVYEIKVDYMYVNEMEYEGGVHCVTVPNGLIVTRRNGSVTVGGNSGALQRLVIGGKLDVAGRSVINIDPRLDLDEIGMPEKQAWSLYKDFIIRKLVMAGMSPLQATKSVADHTPLAKHALLQVMDERPVIATRAPALHKFSVQAFKPKLIPGDVLKLNSVVQQGYNADNDGNCVDYDTEIYLRFAVDNSFSDVIVNSVRAKGALESEKGDYKMLTAENTVLILKLGQGDRYGYYDGPIGQFPLQGTPSKDRNGADVYDVQDPVYVWSFDDKTNKFGWYRITKFTVENDCDTCKVVIGNQSVIASTNESMSVFDPETGLLKKETPQKAIGMFVPCCNQLPTQDGDRDGTFHEGWLHGMLLMRGWISGKYVGFTLSDPVSAEAVIDRFKEITGADCSFTRHGNKLVTSEKAALLWALDRDIYTEDETHAKTLNKKAAFILSDDYMWGLLSGLIDSGLLLHDTGTVSGATILTFSYRTSSETLAKALVALLRRMQINVSLTEACTTSGATEYRLTICPADIKSNLSRIYCVNEDASSKLSNWSDEEGMRNDHDVVPYTLGEQLVLKKCFNKKKDHAFNNGLRKGYATRSNLERHLASVDPELLPELRARVAAKNVIWQKIKSVEDTGKRTVFDMCVPDTSVFVTNDGPVVWDTMTYYVPVSKKAVQEAYDIMMPSKNQLAARDFKEMPKLQEELVSGAWLASHKKNGPVKAVFNTKAEAEAAYRKGDIDVDDNIIIKELQ